VVAVIELTDALRRFAQRVEGVLDRALPPASQPPQRLHEAMRYSVLGGGKRIRPMLAYAATVALGAPVARADAAAAAVEIIHAYSLIHDDLPAMDDDDLRRGKPTCHVAFDEATAILAGDALQALAFEVLAGADCADGTRVEMLRRLAAACGAEGMAGGQALDLAAVGQQLTLAELERMHVHKTGALIRASVALGCLSSGKAGDGILAPLERYGHSVGLSFQIRDDILDVEGDTEVIGKQRGADAARDKPTYPAILGMDAARRLAEDQRESALDALERARRVEPSLELDALRDLAHYAVDRRS
jgi:geranylgeranyl pyrophosphate synthase